MLNTIELESKIIAELTAKVTSLEKHLIFVERWANHHGQKAHTTAIEALSCIQHYPPILAITRGYVDGVVPETYNPYAVISIQANLIKELESIIFTKGDIE